MMMRSLARFRWLCSRAGILRRRFSSQAASTDQPTDSSSTVKSSMSSRAIIDSCSGSEVNYRAFEDQLFDAMSSSDGGTDGGRFVQLSRFLREMKDVGLRRSDPRLAETVAMITRLTLQQRDASDIKLSREMLRNLVCDNIVLIRRALVGDFVVHDFPKFCNLIDEIYWSCRSNTSGRVSPYLPQLSRQKADQWAIALCTIDGQRHANGDYDVPFAVQSGGRPINYAICANEIGDDNVHQFVGHEPFADELTPATVQLTRDGIPPNPLISAGAMVIASLLRTGQSLEDRFESIISEYRRLAGGGFVSFNNSMFLEENEIADHNRAMGYFLRLSRCFPAGVNLHETLDLYFQLHCMEITADSGAVIAATLANGGYCPITGEQVAGLYLFVEVLEMYVELHRTMMDCLELPKSTGCLFVLAVQLNGIYLK